MAVEEAHFLVLLPSHVVHTLIGLHISDLQTVKTLLGFFFSQMKHYFELSLQKKMNLINYDRVLGPPK